MNTHPVARRVRRCAAVALLGLRAAGAPAAPDPDSLHQSRLQRVPVEELKAMYLNCNREALAGRLDAGAIMACSVVYETLKQRAFGGDFDALRSWSRARDADAGVASEAPTGGG